MPGGLKYFCEKTEGRMWISEVYVVMDESLWLFPELQSLGSLLSHPTKVINNYLFLIMQVSKQNILAL